MIQLKNLIKSSIILQESRKYAKELVRQNKISPDIFKKIEDIDPTKTKKFMGWMAKQWSLKNVADIDELRNTIEEFNSFLERKKTKYPDIYNYKSFKDIKDDVDTLNSMGSMSVSELERDYEVVQDDSDLYVAVPHSHEASRKLGLSKFAYRDCGDGKKDSAWCTTYKAPNHFNDYYYTHNVTFYYILVKNDEIKEKLKEEGYGPEFYTVALALLDEQNSEKATLRGLPNMDAYDGLDHQFTGEKLKKYLNIIGLE